MKDAPIRLLSNFTDERRDDELLSHESLHQKGRKCDRTERYFCKKKKKGMTNAQQHN